MITPLTAIAIHSMFDCFESLLQGSWPDMRGKANGH